MIWFLIVTLCLLRAYSWRTDFLPNERSSLDDCVLRYYNKHLLSIGYGDVGGKPAKIKEFPHMTAIGWTNSNGSIDWKCGGSLVWLNFVLTAAHCVLDSHNKAPDVVRLGDIDTKSSNNNKWAQQLKIVKIIRHPEHRFRANYHDIALLKLEKDVTETPYVIPACLWADAEVRFKKLTAPGWGRLGEAEDYSTDLQKVSLTPISNEECKKSYPASRKLKQGINSQHICAFDKIMDTCEGDSGGPLSINLMHNSRMTPFIVGITSFGTACGVSIPGVYTRVSTYFQWIVDTMRQNGAAALEENYNETNCALRFLSYRDYYKPRYTVTHDGVFTSTQSLRRNIEKHPETLARIQWNIRGPDCYGVIVDEDTILTVADCTTYKGLSPSYVIYLKNKVMPISKIIVHPNHVQGTANNNIAILKLNQLLDLPLDFSPSCISRTPQFVIDIYLYGKGRNDINEFKGYGEQTPIMDHRHSIRQVQTTLLNNSNCIVPETFQARLTNGLAADHICFGEDAFLVPKSCDQLTGSMVGFYSGKYFSTFALSLFSQDCGFGEHMLGTRLDSHIEWLKSELLPDYRDSSAVNYVDVDLQEGDKCSLGGGLIGQCVPEDMCNNQLKQPTGQVTFCSSVSIICCSPQNIDISSRIHRDIVTCPELVKDLPRTTDYGSLGHIGWILNGTIQFRCYGSVISQSSIITTASCLQDSRPDIVILHESKVQVAVGSVLIHPEFNLTDRTNDIALIKLNEPLSWNATIFPICLWTNMTHTPVQLDINVLTVNELNPMYGSDCQRNYPYKIKDSQLCTRSSYGDGVCVSPSDQLFFFDYTEYYNRRFYLVGLSTNSCKQVEWKFSIFTRISAFLEWISDNAF